MKAHIQELLWLADYYKRSGQPENSELIIESVKTTENSEDEWAPVRKLEELVAKMHERKSA